MSKALVLAAVALALSTATASAQVYVTPGYGYGYATPVIRLDMGMTTHPGIGTEAIGAAPGTGGAKALTRP